MTGVAELQGEALPETTGEGAELEESPTSEVEETDQDDSPAEPEKPKAKGVQKRIDELTSNWRSAERRAEWLERQLEHQLEQSRQPKQPETKPQGKPQLDQFENYEDYMEAVADWKVEERLKATQEQQRQQEQQRTAQQREMAFQQRAQSFAQTHPDFDQVVRNPALPISQEMYEAAQSSDKGPELLYHLGQNPEEAARIYRLSPFEQAMELGRIEAKLSRPTRNQTSAPPPVEPISGTGGNPLSDPDKMSVEEWKEWRNRQLKR